MARIEKAPLAATSAYPLNPEGSLCPLLRDGELLLSFYDGVGSKPDIKRFIKRNRWPGKPPISYSVGPETMKKVLLSLHDSPEGRTRLESATAKHDNPTVLYQVIWNWVGTQEPELIQAVDNHSHTVRDRVYMSPEELEALLDEQLKDDQRDEAGRTRLVYLALAFAMLQPDDSATLLAVTAGRLPEFREAIGLG